MTIRQPARRARHAVTLAALLAIAAPDAGAQPGPAPKGRPAGVYGAAGGAQLEVDGQRVPTFSIEGGAMAADIVSNDLGPDNVQKKHVANIRWTPFTVRLDPGSMGKAMHEWVKVTLDKGYTTKSGTVTSPVAATTSTFEDAVMTRIAVTGLDAARPGSCQLEVRFEAERVRMAKGGPAAAGAPFDKGSASQCSGFRVELPGLENIAAAVTRIDSIVVTQTIAADQIGIAREPTKHPAKVTVSNVTLTLPEAKSQEVWEWARKWFVDGNHREEHEFTMRVVLLRTMGKEVVSFDGMGVGLVSVRSVTEASGQRVVQVELYVEKWQLNGGPVS